MLKKVFALNIVFLFLCIFAAYAEEAITITTYYPSPYGSYNELSSTGETNLATTSGNVGIGTDTPAAKIDVRATAKDGIFVRTTGAVAAAVAHFDSNLTDTTQVLRVTSNSSTNVVMAALANGNVGIGTATPGNYKLNVNGNLYASGGYKPGGGSWSDSSDIRLKNNIRPIQGALEKILKLHGVQFEWTEPEHARLFPGFQFGMIGQEVESAFPQWIETDSAGYKVLTFRGMEALTVEAIRELKSENSKLKEKNTELEARIKSIEAKLK